MCGVKSRSTVPEEENKLMALTHQLQETWFPALVVVDVYDMCMYFAGKCVWHDRIQVGKTVININRVEVVQIFILQV